MANAVATAPETKELRMQEALREALRSEMARDPRVFVMGEDVALFGGAYGVTRGLIARVRRQARARHADLRIRSGWPSRRCGDQRHAARGGNSIRRFAAARHGSVGVARGALSLYDRWSSECANGHTHQVRHACRRRTEPLEL